MPLDLCRRSAWRMNQLSLHRMRAVAHCSTCFNNFADIHSEYVVYCDGYRSWSYRYDEIAGASRAFAERLRRESIGKGDKVIIWSEARPEWIAAFWGCLLNGSIVVPIDYRSSAEVMCNTQRWCTRG